MLPPGTKVPVAVLVPVTLAGCGAGGLQTAGVMISDQARMLPTSMPAKSCTSNCQFPLAVSPSKADKEELGVKLPVNGAVTAAWMLGSPPSSLSRVWQKLLPPPSMKAATTTDVREGEINVSWRSLTKVWSRPTVVDPSAVVQTVPSIRKSTSTMLPGKAATGRMATAGGPGLSGIGTGGPV